MALVARSLAHPSGRGRRILKTVGALLAVVLAAGPGAAAVDVDLQRYALAERAGAIVPVGGRAYAERRTPDGPEIPLTGATVVAMPWSETLTRRLQQLKEGARASAAAYRETAALMQRAREAYETELQAAGEPDLVRTAVVDPRGRFDLGRLPAGRWLIIATSESFHETSGPRAERKDREMYSPRPRLVGFHTRAVWLRDVAVVAEPVELELTDRNIWFTGVVEQRVVDPVPGRR